MTRRRHPSLWIAMALATSSLSGCRCSEPPAEKEEPAKASPTIQRGDAVLVEPNAGDFFEARVLGLEPAAGIQSLKLQRSDGEITTADAVDVYKLPDESAAAAASKQPGLAPGRLVICEVAHQRWVGCRIKTVSEDGYQIEDFGGEEHRISLKKLMLPSELTRMNLEQRFKIGDRRRAFEREAARAGQPAPPPGFSPGFKERVIAKRGDEWFSAHIVRFHDDGAFRVRWMADDRENDVAKVEVIPEPPYQQPPKRGGFVLLKPNVQSLPWARWRVVSVRPELVLQNAAGEQSQSSRREVVPLDPDVAASDEESP
ncbi:MAG: hypothetical protein KC492_12600 [Myxococcales bacterium]|nr:hypothetical protein [Myxococcales bacterium]